MVDAENSTNEAVKHPSILKTGRRQCYQARDRYYSCIEGLGLNFSAEDTSVKYVDACRKYRDTFESLCIPSWVKHFDRAKETENSLYRTLASRIGESPNSGVGQGKDQR